MILLPKDCDIPKLYATEDQKDPICHIKLFTPDANWTWYIIEIDEAKELCFGYVIGHEKELGYFTMSELRALRRGLTLPIERDLSFTPTSLSEVKIIENNKEYL